MPPLRLEDAPRRRPTLLAAAVALITGGGLLAALLVLDPFDGVQPAVDRGAPAVPYVIGPRLVVDGERAPGDWSAVDSRGGVWLGWRSDDTYWWGRGADPVLLDDPPPLVAEGRSSHPVLSPGGRYLAYLSRAQGITSLSVLDLSLDGAAPVTDVVGSPEQVQVAGVTDEGAVVLSGTSASILRPGPRATSRDDVDLTVTAPDQRVLQATAAGLVVVEAVDSEGDPGSSTPYLAELSTAGDLTRTGTLPRYYSLSIGPDGDRYVREEPLYDDEGVMRDPEPLLVGSIDDQDDERALVDPAGRRLMWGGIEWEDDETVIVRTAPEDLDPSGPDPLVRLARCDVDSGTCRLLDLRDLP